MITDLLKEIRMQGKRDMERREYLKETIDNLNTIITLNGVTLLDLVYSFYCNKKITERQFMLIRSVLDDSK